MTDKLIRRRTFVGQTAAASATLALTSFADAADVPRRRIKVGIIGCGSVSTQYLPHLANCPHVELTSTCDIIPERARAQAKRYNVPNRYPHIDQMLAGAAFDLLVNLTDMQEHERLNRQALEAGKHVWSEKPLANSLTAGQQLLQ
jgi:predicted dehydrogenase